VTPPYAALHAEPSCHLIVRPAWCWLRVAALPPDHAACPVLCAGSRLVDEVERITGDRATAWLYTADHGMSDQASHGDGHPHNTETPYVVWGAGVGAPPPAAVAAAHASSDGSVLWGYDSPLRLDVEQVLDRPAGRGGKAQVAGWVRRAC
jgi:hypothetical protein